MGFNKRYIEKAEVLFQLKNKSLYPIIRDHKIDLLFKADALIMDSWVGRFYSDLNSKERQIRRNLHERYRFDSGVSFIYDDDYKDLISFSEALISLCDDDSASWIDIHMVLAKLNVKIDNDTESGKYTILRQKCIDAIINHFDGK
jgi:hypothetical protein